MEKLAKKSEIKINPHKIPRSILIEDKKYILIAESEYLAMQETIKNNKNELIESMLEKEILREMPKDFDDVYVVAKNLINQSHKKDITIYDIKRAIKDIKLNYPNLFVDIDSYLNDITLMSLND